MNNKQNEREALGARLRAIREEKEISIYKIVKYTGISRKQVHNIEKGTVNYTIDMLLNYLDAIEESITIK
jgi:transcriptional regulator with XRE-family HTH domain